MDGGVFRLLGLIHRHRGAVEYDWRTRFRLGLKDIGGEMSIHEAARQVEILLSDPSSATAAAAAGWDYPITHEALALYDLFDLTLRANSDGRSRPKPHSGRPFEVGNSDVQRVGNPGGRTREEVIDFLTRLGHKLSA